ncbi:unnamed protein product [Nesidiocoris tenuis]|uniref:Serine/threonine protein phosphatase 2A regulatory subunit n=1 Tax=Nesidiocoris tenuis TaxID=355587 RepID=A0A6H5GE44_9HEMI|nr:unnamed protein product [Nesidiocoris tenuis]
MSSTAPWGSYTATMAAFPSVIHIGTHTKTSLREDRHSATPGNSSKLPAAPEDPEPPEADIKAVLDLTDSDLTAKERECLVNLHACCSEYSLISVEKQPDKTEVRFKMLDDIKDFIDDEEKNLHERIFAMVVRLFRCDVIRPLPPVTAEGLELDEDETKPMDPIWPIIFPLYRIFTRIFERPDFNVELGKKYVTEKFIISILDLFNVENTMEREALRNLLHRIYAKILARRPYIRKQMNFVFYRIVQDMESMNGISELLEINVSIISGFNVPLRNEHRNSLLHALLPLFKSFQLPSFYPQLVCCVAQFIDKDPSLTEIIVARLLKYWPKTCSQKEVIFLTTIEQIMDIIDPDVFAKVQMPIFQRIANCIVSPHFQVAERALGFWYNDYFVELLQQNQAVLMPIVFPSIYEAKTHWNKTIVALAYNVLKVFGETNSELYNSLVKPYRVIEGVRNLELGQ